VFDTRYNLRALYFEAHLVLSFIHISMYFFNVFLHFRGSKEMAALSQLLISDRSSLAALTKDVSNR